ncbi:UL11 protein [Gallid alphaherpesvirus 3]|uniref:UL11 protein n=3 Tax=Gallid alphaherpesvirus 3 TaxID=35250 RepID=Q782T5_9ALPH|nr:myristylated tegument protein [Gallid alphaherpesvirus 3]YP_010795604.1 UL11-like protein [Gallid alphaherpesvirus 3]BAA82905.1 UL11 product homolog [Marek's disease virus serotype 2 MDV2]AEI00213.1 UL11-like protein [Gallid alphaherpesvirus 3]QEY02322.1 UL11-like protein [Gallid alphaherpesvirus 3]BAB16519.1 UL11 protein [Gallid alphaherpesvirus 3]
MGQAISVTELFRRCRKRNTVLTKTGHVIELDDEQYDTVDLDGLRSSDPLIHSDTVLAGSTCARGKTLFRFKDGREQCNDTL